MSVPRRGEPLLQRQPRTFWRMALRSLRHERLSIVDHFLPLMGLLAVLAGVITGAMGVNPTATDPKSSFRRPISGPTSAG